jgi:hypothetical protein
MKIHNKLNQFHSFKTTTIFPILLVIASVNFGGCTSGKDYNTFRQEQANNLQAQYAAANGVYNGAVISKIDGSVLGSMQLTIKASSEVQNSSDQLGSEKKAVMKGQLSYWGIVNSNVTFNQGFYNPDTKEFSVTVPVTDESNQIQNIKIEGTIQNKSFIGEVYLDQFPSFGAKTNLAINANVKQASLDLKAARVAQMAGDNMVYQGKYTAPSGTLYNLTMRVGAPVVNIQQQFLRVLNPQRNVSVTINTDSGTTAFLFNNAMINDEVGGLTANTIYNDGTSQYIVNLKCLKNLNNDTQAWVCSVTQGPNAFDVTFTAVTGNVKTH